MWDTRRRLLGFRIWLIIYHLSFFSFSKYPYLHNRKDNIDFKKERNNKYKRLCRDFIYDPTATPASYKDSAQLLIFPILVQLFLSSLQS